MCIVLINLLYECGRSDGCNKWVDFNLGGTIVQGQVCYNEIHGPMGTKMIYQDYINSSHTNLCTIILLIVSRI